VDFERLEKLLEVHDLNIPESPLRRQLGVLETELNGWLRLHNRGYQADAADAQPGRWGSELDLSAEGETRALRYASDYVKEFSQQPRPEPQTALQRMVDENPDRELALRETAPTRLRWFTDKASPVCKGAKLSLEGVIGLLSKRIITFGTPFAVKGPFTFLGSDSFNSATSKFAAKDVCNMRIQGTANKHRNTGQIHHIVRGAQRVTDFVSSTRSYLDVVNFLCNNEGLRPLFRTLENGPIYVGTESKSVPYLSVDVDHEEIYERIHPEKRDAQGRLLYRYSGKEIALPSHVSTVPNCGGLTAYLIATDWAKAGILDGPPLDEFAEFVISLDRGALTGLARLGLIDVHETSRHKYIANGTAAFKKVLVHLQSCDLNLPGTEKVDMYMCEHALCKIGCWLKRTKYVERLWHLPGKTTAKPRQSSHTMQSHVSAAVTQPHRGCSVPGPGYRTGHTGRTAPVWRTQHVSTPESGDPATSTEEDYSGTEHNQPEPSISPHMLSDEPRRGPARQAKSNQLEHTIS
jgi:hypothetical protein